ncbi:MAG: DUF4363 family protein [Clostridia bacterium]
MRSVVISAVLAVVIIAGSLMYTNNLEKVSRELSYINEQVAECLERDDYTGAEAGVERLSAYLDRKRAMLDAIGNHEEMDKIEMNISELAEYTRGKQKADALSRNHVLDFLFEHLPLNYKLKFENIL